MELRQLKYFLAVADARSFANAASANYISRQAISKAISHLEAELGTELFVRDANGAFLTPAGVLFYDRIRSSVIELDQVRNHMQHYNKRYLQQIRIAFGVGLVPLYEEQLLAFGREQNNLVLKYWESSEEECPQLLRERKADLVFTASKFQDPEFECTPLLHSRYGVLLQDTENLRGTESLSFTDLTWLPMAGIDDSSNRVLCKEHKVALQYRGFDTYRLFRLTRSGQCAMLLPECLIPQEIPGLRWIPLENVASWTLYSVCLKSLENNVLYRTTMDELLAEVFESASQHQKERSPVL